MSTALIIRPNSLPKRKVKAKIALMAGEAALLKRRAKRRVKRQKKRARLAIMGSTAVVPYSGQVVVRKKKKKKKKSKISRALMKMGTMRNQEVFDRFSPRREFWFTLLGNTSTTLPSVTDAYINPGNLSCFPIFSRIAETYQQYKLKNLGLMFKTDSYTANAVASAAGYMMVAVNFEAAEPVFNTFGQFQNHSSFQEEVIYHDMTWVIPVKSNHTRGLDIERMLPVNVSNNAPVPFYGVAGASATDANLYNIGRIQITCKGNSNTSPVADVFITHQFEMMEAREPDGSIDTVSAHFRGTPVNGDAFGSFVTKTPNSEISGVFAPNACTLTVLRPLANHVMFVTYSANAVTSYTGGGLLVGTGSTTGVENSFANGSYGNVAGSGTTAFINTCLFGTTDNSAVYTFTITSPTVVGATSADLWVDYIPVSVLGEFSAIRVIDNGPVYRDELADMRAKYDKLTVKVNALMEHLGEVPDDVLQEAKVNTPSVPSSQQATPRR